MIFKPGSHAHHGLKMQMAHPLVSIIINNFNYAQFLNNAIDSALAQTYPEIEVIVVDDASTDTSPDVIQSYGARIKALLSETNRGQAAAMNAGFAISRGDIIIFLDADDYLYPQAVSEVAAAWSAGLAKAQYRLDMIDAEQRWISLFPPAEVAFDSGDVRQLLLECGRYEGTVTSGNAFSREVLSAVLPIPEQDFRISADGYLVTIAPLHGQVVSIDRPLGVYRQHGANNWSNVEKLEQKLRKALAHDEVRCRALKAAAGQLGLTPAQSPGLSDHFHLSCRIASLRLDPAQHPMPGDTRLGLLWHGVWSSRKARLSVLRRALLAIWFVVVGIAPAGVARGAIEWRITKSSRPRVVDDVFTAVRRFAR